MAWLTPHLKHRVEWEGHDDDERAQVAHPVGALEGPQVRHVGVAVPHGGGGDGDRGHLGGGGKWG